MSSGKESRDEVNARALLYVVSALLLLLMLMIICLFINAELDRSHALANDSTEDVNVIDVDSPTSQSRDLFPAFGRRFRFGKEVGGAGVSG